MAGTTVEVTAGSHLDVPIDAVAGAVIATPGSLPALVKMLVGRSESGRSLACAVLLNLSAAPSDERKYSRCVRGTSA